MRRIILIILTVLIGLTTRAQKQLTVAQDGSGNFKTVQEAINAVPDNSAKETIIYIKKGVYKEKLTLPASKEHVTLKADDPLQTIITYDDYASKKDSAGKNIGTSGSASFHMYGKHFSAYNITFANSSGPVGQAVAAWVGGDRTYFYNCRFLGFQDTLYTFGTGTVQCYNKCYIEGTVDFIFGAATAWFEECRILCKNTGYITAASTPDTVKYGYVFNKCTITGELPTQSHFLGRPWRPYAKTVFMNCDLSKQIKAEGWQIWSNKDNISTTYYAEYNNRGEGADTTKRAEWTHQLDKKQAADYTMKNVLKGWTPGK